MTVRKAPTSSHPDFVDLGALADLTPTRREDVATPRVELRLDLGAGLGQYGALMQKMKGREAFLAFGSEQHFDLWSSSALKFKEALEESQLLHKSRVIVAPFVDRTLEGGKVALTRNLDAGEWNSHYLRYYNLLDQIGFELVEIPTEYVVSTVKHKWGSAQYHYIDAAYDALASLIE